MLLSLIVGIVIIGLIVYCLSLLPLPEPFRTIVYVLGIVIAIIYLVEVLHGGTSVSLL